MKKRGAKSLGVSYIDEFRQFKYPRDLHEKVADYERIKSIAQQRGNEKLVNHCKYVLEELEKVRKEKRWR